MFFEDELVQAKTISGLADLILKEMEQPVTQQCLSATMFYKLRRAVMELFDVVRAKITPTILF